MVYVIATIRAKPGQRDALVAAFGELTPKVLAEQGCRAYVATIDADTDIDRQARVGGDVVTMIEQWDSVDHLKAHLAAAHMTAFGEKASGLIASIELRVHAPA